MEQYGKILAIAMPVFLLLVIVEKLYGIQKGNTSFSIMDTVSSLSSGITNVVKDVLGLSLSIVSYTFIVQKIAIFHVESSILLYFIAFIVLDFQGYWVHRWSHQINIFWNKHAIHHSSEEFDLACALRQSISSFVNLFTFFLIPAALFGVPPMIIAIVAPIHLFMQFWYHTEYINKMGILEYVIVTPSHHRVHHAMNKDYLDKNFGQILIIWDKLFGTFQAELVNTKPIYGITRPASTWNPIKINFQHLILLVKDAWHTNNFKDKLKIWFMPTGWRPEDVVEAYPIEHIDDVYTFQKYNTNASNVLKIWSTFQLIGIFLFALFVFKNIAFIKIPELYLFGLLVFIAVYGFTQLMDKKRDVMIWELIKLGVGVFFLLRIQQETSISQVFSSFNTIYIFWLIVSVFGSIFLSFYELKWRKSETKFQEDK